jgi:hypothetical protein
MGIKIIHHLWEKEFDELNKKGREQFFEEAIVVNGGYHRIFGRCSLLFYWIFRAIALFLDFPSISFAFNLESLPVKHP